MNVYFGHGTKKTYPQRRRGAYRADEGSMRDGEAGFEHNHRGPLFELPRAIRPIRKADGKEEEETLTRLARAPRLRLTAFRTLATHPTSEETWLLRVYQNPTITNRAAGSVTFNPRRKEGRLQRVQTRREPFSCGGFPRASIFPLKCSR